MSDTGLMPQGVHLVGSVPLESNTAVFTMVATILGQHLQRLPDGKTGSRRGWIGWQVPIIRGMSQLEETTILGGLGGPYGTHQLLKLRPGVTPEEIQFPALVYSTAAIAFYSEFVRLKRDG